MSLPHMLGRPCRDSRQYNALLVDIWGVLHNGQTPFEGVDAALLNYRQQGGKVLLLSNAPRPGAVCREDVEVIGNRRDGFDDILTSGDAVRALMSDMGREGKKICHIGPEKDADLITDLEVEFVDEDAADAILFSGPYDDTTETPDDYADMLARMAGAQFTAFMPQSRPHRAIWR